MRSIQPDEDTMPARANVRSVWVGLALFVVPTLRVHAAEPPPPTLTVQVDRPGPRISPTMWGIFFEDINFAADGGLFAELVKNRSFEFPDPMMGWKEVASNKFSLNNQSGSVEIINRGEGNENNPRFARVIVNGPEFQLMNEGFF